MSFDIYTRFYSLLAERINVPICKEKRSDTICSDIVKVDSQKELTQSTFLFFIL